jgi:hypothetical protein
MPVSNPSAASSNPSAASQAQSPDVAQLVALLGSLMPLLLQFQSQTLEPPFQSGPFQAGPFQAGPFQSGPFQPGPFQAGPFQGLGNVLIPNPALDHQAAVNLAGDITADSLRNLSAYLEANAGRHAGLENCVPIVTQAARSFAARDYAQAFNLIWLAYRVIATIRAGDPQLPPLRAGRLDSTFPSDPTSSIH